MTQTIGPVLGEATVQELREAVRGNVVTPADAGYVEASHAWNGAYDGRRPALIVRCTGAADVIAAVGFARSNHLDIAVRGGGHSVAGMSLTDGGIVIDVRRMNEVTVDPDARTARVSGGATVGDLDRATQPYGLATTGGRVSTTGMGGFTLALVEGRPLPDILRFASATAALKCTKFGGASGAPMRADVEAFLKQRG